MYTGLTPYTFYPFIWNMDIGNQYKRMYDQEEDHTSEDSLGFYLGALNYVQISPWSASANPALFFYLCSILFGLGFDGSGNMFMMSNVPNHIFILNYWTVNQ